MRDFLTVAVSRIMLDHGDDLNVVVLLHSLQRREQRVMPVRMDGVLHPSFGNGDEDVVEELVEWVERLQLQDGRPSEKLVLIFKKSACYSGKPHGKFT